MYSYLKFFAFKISIRVEKLEDLHGRFPTGLVTQSGHMLKDRGAGFQFPHSIALCESFVCCFTNYKYKSCLKMTQADLDRFSRSAT